MERRTHFYRGRIFFLFFIFVGISSFFHLKSQTRIKVCQKKLSSANLHNYRLILESLDSLVKQLPPSQAQAVAKENVKIAQKTKNPRVICLAEIYLRIIEGIRLKKTNLNLDKFLELLNYAQLNNFQYEYAFICKNLALIYNLMEVHAKGLYYAEESIRMFEQLNLHYKAILNYYDVGIAFYKLGEYKKAEKYLKRVFYENTPFSDLRSKMNAYNALGLVQFHLGKYESALPYFEKALQLAEAGRDSSWISIMNGNLGQAYGKMKKYELAQEYLKKDIELSQVFNLKVNAAISMTYSGDFYRENNQIQEALQQYTKGLRLLKAYHQNKEDEQFIKLFYGIAHCLQRLNRLQDAQSYLDTVLIYQNSLIQASKIREIEVVRKNVRIDRQEHKIELLSWENQQNKFMLSKQRFQQILLFVFCLFISFILIFFYFSNLQYKKNNLRLQNRNNTILQQSAIIEEKNREIAAQNEELQAQNELLTSQKEENEQQKDLIQNQYDELKILHTQLESQKKELDEALIKIQEDEKIILQQNERLKNYNQDLEQEVLHRTRELSEKNEELVNTNNQLEQFSFITAHNLRAPIANLLGLCNFILDDPHDTSELLLFIEKINLTTLSLDQIIKDLAKTLEIRKNMEKSREMIHFETLILKTLILLEPQIKESNAQMELQFSALPQISSVTLYWESIFYNLISNAIKYRNPSRPLKIQVGNQISGNELLIYAQDNGQGIDMTKHGNDLFGLYKRFHTDIEGKGMGLHLVKLQVEAMGGKITASSAPGKGTTFEIRVPLNDG